MISKPQGAPFASWVTGWFNLLGQIAVTTGIGSVVWSQSHTNLCLICLLVSRAQTLSLLRPVSLQTTNRTHPRRSGSSPLFFLRKVQRMLYTIYVPGPDRPSRRYDQHIWRALSQIYEYCVRVVACLWHNCDHQCYPRCGTQASERQVCLSHIHRRYRPRWHRVVATRKPCLRRCHWYSHGSVHSVRWGAYIV